MKVINVIIAEASLETIPSEVATHPAVISSCKLRKKHWSEVLLDTSLHYSAMKRLPNRLKRGRPDIIHTILLEALSSPINLEGHLKIFIHTLNDQVIFVDPVTRIPRNYVRFVGLIEQLFKYGQVPPNDANPLMRIVNLSFINLLRRIDRSKVITLSESGKHMDCESICRLALSEDLPIVIGGFPHGDFRNDIYECSKYVFSIYGKSLDAWVVVSRILGACERVLGIL
ncbi:MAG: 16S rRNA methyltransferase [Sulfolobales archaeon]|nr:16S rRNA methyltransferase [Sulfolobales archaeon]MCX8186315.1 16S rRNA methyltransferase [Sulfolobales archaeon]MDW7968949.1 16S rRNA methyltransferase [Sulfolobales archaeon]